MNDNKPRSFVTFKDGHEEEIFYIEDNKNLGVLFATSSGIYCFKPATTVIRDSKIVRNPDQFQKIHLDANTYAEEIDSITVDSRDVYEFEIYGYGSFICGEILMPPDATTQDVRKAITDTLDIRYEKKE